LQTQIDSKTADLLAAKEQEKEVVAMLQGMQNKPVDPAKRDAMLNEVLAPFINVLKTIRVFASKTVKTEESFETSIYMNLAQ
jgi:hypothetical protein